MNSIWNKPFPRIRILLRRVICLPLLWALIFSPAPGEGSLSMTALQEKLLSLGYEIGQADGIIGARSQAALRLVQILLSEAGPRIIISGLPDQETVSLVMGGEYDDLLQTLLNGSWGTRVLEAQNRLVGLGFLRSRADGIFGADTESAVRDFESWAAEQKPDLITPDGRLSPAEYDFLLSDLRPYGIESPLYFDESSPASLTPQILYAHNAILINAVTGEVLLEKEADVSVPPASTTKIMTLLTALSLCDPDRQITVPASAADVPPDSSLVPVYPGERMTMRDLLYAMIIRSGNDAANAVAELSAGSVEAFVLRMNENAERLGLKGSYFMNPHGYTEDGHYMSARDLAIIAREGLTQTEFMRIVTCLQYTLPATSNREALPLAIQWEIFQPDSEYYIPHAAGIKSGYTSAAGFCYVGAFQENGKTLIAVVLGCNGKNSAWTDLRRLFAFGLTQ